MLILPLYDDNPRRRLPIATGGLIAACALAFLWQQGLSPRAASQAAFAYGMIPAVLFGHAQLPHALRLLPPWLTIFTSMFLHGGWLHLLGNMLFLWLFGKGVESTLGSGRFLVFYFLCGAVAALTQAAMDPTAEVPMIGASGAIAGVLGAYLVLHPRGNVMVLIWILVFVRLVAVPAVILLGLWFLMQLLSALSAAPGAPGVAFWAHTGGFVFGMALVLLFRPRGAPIFRPARSRPFSVSGWAAPGRRWRRARGPWG